MADSENPSTDDGQTEQRQQDVDSSEAIPPPVTDETLPLSDGRTLGYAEYGPSEGDPLVFCHGLPGSRYTRHPDTSVLDDHGIRQITLDRPGFGRSTYDSERTLLDWPVDVREAADELGIDQFAVVGTSGGGPHALACAARLPERVTSVAVVSGIGPLHAPGATDGMELRNRLEFRIGGFPFVSRLLVWPVVRKIRKDPDAAIDAIGARFANPDEQLLQRPEVRAIFRQDLTAAVRQGTKGLARETRLLARPWGFDLSEVSVPVDLWHGELDENTPVTMARYVAENLPSCTAHIYPEDGHLLILDYWDEILSGLVEHQPGDGTTG